MTAAASARRPIALPVAGEQNGAATPRFIVPIEHFALAFVWLAVAMAGLVLAAPILALGGYSAPVVVAVTHTITLGLVLTAITGALQQLAPAVMGVSARSEYVAHASFALLGVGTLCVVTGAWRWSPALIGAGWSAVVLAITLTWWNLIRHLRRAPRGLEPARAVRAGFASLAAGLAVAFARIGGAMGWWTVTPHALLVAHVHLLVGGFATVIAMGIGGHVLPMFLRSRDVPTALARVAWRATFGGAVGVATGALSGIFVVQLAGAAAMAAGVGAWLVFIGTCLARRSPRELDRTLFLIVMAHALLGCAGVLGFVMLFAPSARGETAYVALALFGWLGLFIAGVAARIIPMLALSRRLAARALGRVSAPSAARPAPLWLARLGVATLALGAMVLPIAIMIGIESGVRAAALVNVAAVVLLLAQHAWRAALRRGA